MQGARHRGQDQGRCAGSWSLNIAASGGVVNEKERPKRTWGQPRPGARLQELDPVFAVCLDRPTRPGCRIIIDSIDDTILPLANQKLRNGTIARGPTRYPNRFDRRCGSCDPHRARTYQGHIATKARELEVDQ